jgi:hypothetical protein
MSAHERDSVDLPPECRDADAYGIDLDLLRANLELSPAQRLSQFQALISLHEQIQRRTLTEALLERRDQLQLAEQLRLWGLVGPPG